MAFPAGRPSLVAVSALITLTSAPVSNRKFKGRANCGTATCTHNRPSEYSKGMAFAGADDAARAPLMSAKPSKRALQKSRIDAVDATDVPDAIFGVSNPCTRLRLVVRSEDRRRREGGT